jgi:hypothetical protein
MAFVVFGSAAAKALRTSNGWKRRTEMTPTFSPLADEPIDGLADRLDAAAHDDDDAFGFGMTVVVEEMILTAGEGGEAVHRGLMMPGSSS